MTDDATMFRRFKAWCWALPPDLRDWVLEILEDTVSRTQRRAARDRLLSEAGQLIPGKPRHRAREVLRIQLWILTPGRTREVLPDTAEAKVAEALSHWPRVARLGRLKVILRNGQDCP